MLHDEVVPIPPAIRAEIEGGISDVDVRARSSAKIHLQGKIFITVASAGLLLLFSRKFSLASEEGLVALASSAFFVLLFWFWPHHKDHGYLPPEVEKEHLRKRLERGTMLKRHLTLTDEHVWIEHEHGVTLYASVDARRTLYVDISSVTVGDDRYSRYEDGTLFRREWTWFQFPQEEHQPHEFKVEGAAFEPLKLGHDDSAGAPLFEVFGSPGDGDVLDRPWPDVRSAIRDKLGR